MSGGTTAAGTSAVGIGASEVTADAVAAGTVSSEVVAANAAAAAASGITLTSVAEAASLASTVIGGVTAAAGAGNAAQAQANAANYNAQVAANNETAAQNAAGLTEASAQQASANQGLQTRQVVGSVLAAQGASNVDVNTGSAPAVRLGDTLAGNTNQQTTLSTGAYNSYQQLQQGQNFGAQSQLSAMQAQSSLQAGNIAAESALFGGAGSAATNLANWELKTAGNNTVY